jgi:hypothetical protein
LFNMRFSGSLIYSTHKRYLSNHVNMKDKIDYRLALRVGTTRYKLAVFPDCTRRYWVDMWSAHRIPQLHFQLSKPDQCRYEIQEQK